MSTAINQKGKVVKQEDSDDVAIIAAPAPAAPQESVLCELTVEQAAKCPFPIGSTVWQKSKGYHMSSGSVKSVSIDILSRQLLYKITATTIEDLHDDNNDTLVSEGDICLGAGCPVRVKTSNDGELDGIILHGKVSKGVVAYSVLMYVDGDKKIFKTEERVAPERVKYRSISSDCNQGDFDLIFRIARHFF